MHGKVNYLIKTGVFSLVGNYLRPSNNYRRSNFNINAVVWILIICKIYEIGKMYTWILVFYCVLEN